MFKNILLVGTGGFIGSALRYLVNLAVIESTHPLPIGTLVVNVVGCFIIGIVYGIADKTGYLGQWWIVFLATGICGGFTTFSAFAYENVRLLQSGEYGMFLLYTAGSIVIGLLAVVCGIVLTKLF